MLGQRVLVASVLAISLLATGCAKAPPAEQATSKPASAPVVDESKSDPLVAATVRQIEASGTPVESAWITGYLISVFSATPEGLRTGRAATELLVFKDGLVARLTGMYGGFGTSFGMSEERLGPEPVAEGRDRAKAQRVALDTLGLTSPETTHVQSAVSSYVIAVRGKDGIDYEAWVPPGGPKKDRPLSYGESYEPWTPRSRTRRPPARDALLEKAASVFGSPSAPATDVRTAGYLIEWEGRSASNLGPVAVTTDGAPRKLGPDYGTRTDFGSLRLRRLQPEPFGGRGSPQFAAQRAQEVLRKTDLAYDNVHGEAYAYLVSFRKTDGSTGYGLISPDGQISRTVSGPPTEDIVVPRDAFLEAAAAKLAPGVKGAEAEINDYLVDWVGPGGSPVTELAVPPYGGNLYRLTRRGTPRAVSGDKPASRLLPVSPRESAAQERALKEASKRVAGRYPVFANARPRVYSYLVRVTVPGSYHARWAWIDPDGGNVHIVSGPPKERWRQK